MFNRDQLLEAVININIYLSDQGMDDGEVSLIYSSDGFVEIVKFLGCQIYNSQVDVIEEGEFSSVDDYLRCRVNELISYIKNIEV